MKLFELLSEDRIYFIEKKSNKKEILEFLSERYAGENKKLQEKILKAFLKREKISSTGIGKGVAIPHAILKEIKRINAIVLISKEGISFDAIDGKDVFVIVGIFANINEQKLYLSLLANCARIFSKEDIISNILKSNNKKEIIDIIKEVSDI